MEKKTKKTKKLKLVPDKLTEENMEQVYKEKFEKINILNKINNVLIKYRLY